MALPDSGMSIVLAISSELIRRRAEVILKENPDVACQDDITMDDETTYRNILIFSHPDADETYFLEENDEIFVMIGVKLGVTLGIDWLVNAHLKLRLVGASAGDDLQTASIVMSFVSLEFELDILSENDQLQLNSHIRTQMDPIIEGFQAEVPLHAVLSDGVEIVDPIELRLPDTLTAASTLVLGIAVSGDDFVKRDQFHDAYNSNPRGQFDWFLSIDSGIMRAMINEELASMDFTEDAPDDNGIEGWIDTEETAAYWSGDNITGELMFIWHENDVRNRFDEHPIWLKIIGYYKSGLGFAPLSYVLGQADLIVDDDENGAPTIFIDVFLFAAGSGVVPFPLSAEDQPEPVAITSAFVADHLRVSNISWDRTRLNFGGVDDHPGVPGYGAIQVPSEISVVYDKGERSPCRPFFGDLSSQNGATLLNSNTIVESFWIQNKGEGPLWICRLDLDDPDGVYEVQPSAELPVAIAPEAFLEVGVKLTVADDATHSALLYIRSNDYDGNPLVEVSLSGRIFGEVPVSTYIDRQTCVQKPEEMPPQEWFERLNKLIGEIDQVVQGDLTVDHEIELTLAGLSPDTVIQVIDDQGRVSTQSQLAGRFHHLTTPRQGYKGLRWLGKPLSRNGMMAMQCSITRVEQLAQIRDRDEPTGLAMDNRGIIYALSKERLTIFIHTAEKKVEEVAVYSVDEARQLDLWTHHVMVSTERELHVLDAADPYAPQVRHQMPLPHESRIQVFEDYLLLFAPKSVRVYRLGEQSVPFWVGDLNIDIALSAAVQVGNEIALVGKAGGYMVSSLSRPGLLEARQAKKMPAASLVQAQATKWKTPFPFRLQSLSEGGFTLDVRHAGSLPIDGKAVYHIMGLPEPK